MHVWTILQGWCGQLPSKYYDTVTNFYNYLWFLPIFTSGHVCLEDILRNDNTLIKKNFKNGIIS